MDAHLQAVGDLAMAEADRGRDYRRRAGAAQPSGGTGGDQGSTDTPGLAAPRLDLGISAGSSSITAPPSTKMLAQRATPSTGAVWRRGAYPISIRASRTSRAINAR